MKKLNGLFDLGKKQSYFAGANKDEYEFCPRCDANLTLQKGFDNTLSYWICLGCGEMLINPAVESDSNIAWICDGCGAMLNVQQGFHEECGKWTCLECGFVNEINARELYASEDEYQSELQNPYKGLSDEAVLELSKYYDEALLGDKGNVILVTEQVTGVRYVKKLLSVYDKSVYGYFMKNPVEHMPKIIKLYEGSNCLVVMEEYIQGNTVEELIEEAPLTEQQAVYIAIRICGILKELHHLPDAIIHRDIKPSNIILSPENEVYLLDMNVAKWYHPDKKDDTRYMGTPYYAAPEQVGFGFSSSSPKTDIYAVGILLNVMLTGKLPKEQKASGRIWDIIERCIRLDAEKRYTAEELIEELEGINGEDDAADTNR